LPEPTLLAGEALIAQSAQQRALGHVQFVTLRSPNKFDDRLITQRGAPMRHGAIPFDSPE
jgi:hypothetical protein